jgi:hypothetical protein
MMEWLKYEDKSGVNLIWGSEFQLLYFVRNVITT